MADDGHRTEILIVDNDERIVELVAWFLKKRGYNVRTAQSFEEARAAIAEQRPDLMLSDVDLGAESAREELPRLDACGLLPPTLVVSGYLDPELASELTALAPVLDTLAKPFDFSVLEERVRGCLSKLGKCAAEPVAAVPNTGTAAGSDGSEKASQPHAAEHTEVGAEDDEGWIEITPVPPPSPHSAQRARLE